MYIEYLQELENAVCTLLTAGPVFIIRDFNAHIATAWFNVNQTSVNFLMEMNQMIDCIDHHTVSLTYCSGELKLLKLRRSGGANESTSEISLRTL